MLKKYFSLGSRLGNLKRHVRRNHPEEFAKIEKEEVAAKDAIALAAKKPKAYILLKKNIYTYIYLYEFESDY